MIIPRLAALLLAFSVPALAGDLDGNPVADAARALGTAGLSPGASSPKPLAFAPRPARVFLERFLLGLSDDAGEREQYRQALSQVMQGHEEQARAGGYANDVAGALAFAVCVLQV